LDKTLHELRQHLDVAPYPAAEREGEAMTLDQAIQLAVSLL
jgi:hypothetical protein